MLHLSLILSLIWVFVIYSPVTAQSPLISQSILQASNPDQLTIQGNQKFENGQAKAAISFWQHALQEYQNQKDTLNQAMVLGNLSVGYQQLEQWEDAQRAITTSKQKLTLSTTAPDYAKVRMQVLTAEGSLAFSLGEHEQALASWQEATQLATQLGNDRSRIRNQINQVQALQAMGYHRRACQQLLEAVSITTFNCDMLTTAHLPSPHLTTLQQHLEQQADPKTQIIGLQSLVSLLRHSGKLAAAQEILQQRRAIAERFGLISAIPSIDLDLGNLARDRAKIAKDQNNSTAVQQNTKTALQHYYQVLTNSAASQLTRLQAQLHQLNLFAQNQQWSEVRPLIHSLQEHLANLPPSYAAAYPQVHFVQILLEIAKQNSQLIDSNVLLHSAKLLADVAQQANNPKVKSYVLGQLGQLYEYTGQWAEAQTVTKQAVSLAEAVRMREVSYQWQWQLGRILRKQGDLENARIAYHNAYDHLQSLRRDLASANSDIQFSFRDRVEPVYREYVELLLQNQDETKPNKERLKQARNAIQELQLAELENFFREPCLQPTQLDEVRDQTAAILYPIILNKTIAVIATLPNPENPQERLFYYHKTIVDQDINIVLQNLHSALKNSIQRRRKILDLSQQIYNWILRDLEPELEQSKTKTLVFVSDGLLRNIPMAVLHDGHQYLIEKYAIAVSPTAKLPDPPKPFSDVPLNALVAGSSKFADSRFGSLKAVSNELKAVQTQLAKSTLLSEQEFKKQPFGQLLITNPFTIVHVVTHGQFKSNPNETFILTRDDKITIRELDQLLRDREVKTNQPLELLVLSACATAEGDSRATLGLAGIAARAGARSIVATLWNIDDKSTAEFMEKFYKRLASRTVSKVEALRQTQLDFLHENGLGRSSPYYWAAYVSIGNWL